MHNRSPLPPTYQLPNTCAQRPPSLIHGNHPRIHNLNISNYSVQNIYDLFGLDKSTVSVNDLKTAKRRVLMTHPDKSHLPPDYFQFYTNALRVLVDDFQHSHKEISYGERMKDMQKSDFQYERETEEDLAQKRAYQKTASGKEFMENFNRVFETEMRAPVVDRNEWFRQNQSSYSDLSAKSQADMGRAIQEVKQRQQALIVRRDVSELRGSFGGSSFYDTATDEDTYIAADPFAKLKFDDLRRVHKDETVLSVSERDFENMPKFRNVEEYNRSRTVDQGQWSSISEETSLNMLREREAARAARCNDLLQQDIARQSEFARKQEEARRMILRLNDMV